jgi:hypothetical protein
MTKAKLNEIVVVGSNELKLSVQKRAAEYCLIQQKRILKLEKICILNMWVSAPGGGRQYGNMID